MARLAHTHAIPAWPAPRSPSPGSRPAHRDSARVAPFRLVQHLAPSKYRTRDRTSLPRRPRRTQNRTLRLPYVSCLLCRVYDGFGPCPEKPSRRHAPSPSSSRPCSSTRSSTSARAPTTRSVTPSRRSSDATMPSASSRRYGVTIPSSRRTFVLRSASLRREGGTSDTKLKPCLGVP